MNLKQKRLLAGETQTEVAKAINVTQFTYSNYEKEKTEPSIDVLKKLAAHFNTSVDCLIGYNVPNMLDKSIFRQEQQALIDKIATLTREQCLKIDAYIDGMLAAEEYKQINLKGINKYGR